MSADLNSLGAVGVEDYYKRIRPGLEDRQYLRAGRWIVVGSGLLSMLIAMLYVKAGDQGVLGIVFTLYAIFSGGISGIFLLGLFSSRASSKGMNVAIIACILFTSYAFLTSTKIGSSVLVDLGPYNFTQHKLMLGVYSHLVVIVVGYLASFLFPKQEVDRSLLFSGWRAARRAIPATALLLICCFGVHAQDTTTVDAQYRQPLKVMLDRIQQQYGVSIRYTDDLVKDRWVSYGNWRFRQDAEQTLKNMLTPLDLDFSRQGEKTYKLRKYEYYRRTPEEGWATLDAIAAQYHDKAGWERRVEDLRPCLYQAIGFVADAGFAGYPAYRDTLEEDGWL